ncbi:MAG: glycosyltransferase family 4 protein [Chitinophagaceae bacterium]|nr:glycosyltransferase family 4 protein [Chitinophagaceae bacterium]
MAKKHPEHRFIYIAGKSINKEVLTADNISVEYTGQDTIPALLSHYWHQYRIPALLRKLKAEVYFSADGTCALRGRIKQCSLFTDLSWLEHPRFFSRSRIRSKKRSISLFAGKTDQVISFSQQAAGLLAEKLAVDQKKSFILYPPARDRFKPVDPSYRDLIKEKYAEGKEYFLFSGAITPVNNLMHLLKAYSFFKKRQKSNMLLLIAETGLADDREWLDALGSFKFRQEVIRIPSPDVEELVAITASAYAVVNPVYGLNFSNPCAEAMRCGVPVVCSDIPQHREWFGEAAIYANPEDFNDLAQAMMRVYKDEALRNELIAAGLTRCTLFSQTETARRLWTAFCQPVNG